MGGGTATWKPESSPTYRRLRDLLDRGEYASAVLQAYRSAFDGTVRAYGLNVPASVTDRQFVAEFLRPDMGRLAELLRELLGLYEPVRFGNVTDGDRDAFRALLVKVYSETALARLDHPLYQPRSMRGGPWEVSSLDGSIQPRRPEEGT